MHRNPVHASRRAKARLAAVSISLKTDLFSLFFFLEIFGAVKLSFAYLHMHGPAGALTSRKTQSKLLRDGTTRPVSQPPTRLTDICFGDEFKETHKHQPCLQPYLPLLPRCKYADENNKSSNKPQSVFSRCLPGSSDSRWQIFSPGT